MAINPFRVGELQLPQPLRPVPIDFSPLSQIGESIGQYRQQQEIGSILRGATDESGNLDIQKAASGLGAAGHLVAANRLIDTATRRAAQQASEATARRGQDITKAHYTATEADMAEQRRIAQERLNLEEKTRKQGNIYVEPNALGIGPPTYRRLNPDDTFQTLTPTPAAPAPSPIGPRSDIAPGAMPTASFAERFDPETAPPARVAAVGPTALPGPTAAPQTPPAVQTAQATPAALQQVEQQYGPQATAVLKDMLDYKRGPLKGKEEAWITLARQVDPNYDPLEWERREKQAKAAPPAGETQARIGFGRDFLSKVDNIKERVAAGELTSLSGRGQAFLNTGGPGELKRAINGGAESLERLLTGAGMPASEAARYKRQYEVDELRTVSKEDQRRKVNELEQAIRFVGSAVAEGRGGEDLLKGYQSKFGKPLDEPAPSAKKTPTQTESPKMSKEEVDTFVNGAASRIQRASPDQREAVRNDVYKILRDKRIPPDLWPR